MWRIRFLTDYQLSWHASFQVIMLWEFSSAATPSAVGGTAIALFLLAKEDIPAGKSIALVLCTILLDMTFLLLMLFTGILIFDFNSLFPGGAIAKFNKAFFFLTFSLLLAYTLLVLFGLFGRPQALKWLMVKIMSIRWFKKWQHRAKEIGDQLVHASDELQHRSVGFWLKAFGLTAVTWTGRFAVANCLIMIVTGLHEHFLLLVRQVALMVMLMMAPTPGGSGLAEISFPAFISDLVPMGLVATVTALWRTFTFYPYLFLGLMILPRWVRRVYK